MKFPLALEQLLTKKPDKKKEAFVSLLLHREYIQAAIWNVTKNKEVEMVKHVTKLVPEDTWEAKTESADEAISEMEESMGLVVLDKVVLGLPLPYLTGEGEIEKSVGPHIKKLAHSLELTPVGFVPVHQAIIHELKRDEGVPPNAILLDVTVKEVALTIYKVGVLSGQKIIPLDGTFVTKLEEAFRDFSTIEVLPSRMLLFGVKKDLLESLKRDLLHHPWQTRVNFLHYPKVEVLDVDSPIAAVSYAGASELSAAMVDTEEEVPEEEVYTSISQPSAVVNKQFDQTQEVTPQVEEENLSVVDGTVQNVSELPIAPESPIVSDPLEKTPLPEEEVEETNIKSVDPSELGFVPSEIHPRNIGSKTIEPEETAMSQDFEENQILEDKKPKINPFASIGAVFSRLKIPRVSFPASGIKGKGIVVVVALVFFILLGAYAVLWILPHATVSVIELPKAIVASDTITVDPKATSVDVDGKVIPAALQEKTVSGDKTVPVTGKKQVGDPARGTVVIYNKSLTSRTFPKGTSLKAGALKFTLDSEVSVASASESIGSITFGKTPVAITASQIGPQSNLPASTEFAFTDISTNIASARNEQALGGGTSKDVTVVTRADYDALVASLSEDLLEQAKQELSQSVNGDEKLIDETIKTTVSDKKFDQELDQQTQQLHGKITLTISGMVYNQPDVKQILSDAAKAQVPAGYNFQDTRTDVSLSNPTVKKDGTITVAGELHAIAIPAINIQDIKKQIAGKSITQVTEYLRNVSGVAGVSYSFDKSWTKSKLPMNANNILMKIEVQE